jgi:hypothetical protein
MTSFIASPVSFSVCLRLLLQGQVVIAGLDPAIHPLRKTFSKSNGPPGQARR